MTLYERETHILFNEEENEMEIETPSQTLQKKIESYGQKPGRTAVFDGVTFKTYKLSKKWLHIFKPWSPSEELRRKARETAIANFRHGGE